MNGTIVRINERGFFFIRDAENGSEYFAHCTACRTAFDLLIEGQSVSFELQTSAKGPRAVNVVVTG